MKTIKKILFVATMLTIVTGYANDIKNLELANVKKGHQLTIIDSKGEILYHEAIERNGSYLNKFDLTLLKDGMYSIELDKDFEIIIKPFEVKSNKVLFLNDKETKEFKPVIRVNENQLIISQLSLNNQPLEVKLYYNDELIHKEILKNQSILKQALRLSKSQKGNYSLRMVSGNRVFVETFSF